MSIQWYPGHMHKAQKDIRKILSQIHMVIEVLDVRIPYSSENPMVAQLKSDKPCLKVLTKTDLADPEITAQWLGYFEQQPGVKALAVNSSQLQAVRQLPNLCREMLPHRVEQEKKIHAMIMGIPNVGKSTLINIMAGRQIAKTGNEPAVTKAQQRIQLEQGLVLFDTPGMLWPKVENPNSAYRLAITGAIKDTALDHSDVACFAAQLLLNHYPANLQQRYELNELPASEIELLELIGRQRGCLGGGGHVDFDKVAKLLLHDWRSAALGRISLETPEQAEQEKARVAEQIVREKAEKEAKKAARQAAAKKRRR